MAVVARSAGPRALAACGAGFGAAFFALLLWWVRLFGAEAYAGLVLVETAWVAAALALAAPVRDRLPQRLRHAAFPLCFLAGEYLRTHLPFGGFPWGGLGYVHHDDPGMLRLAAYTGVWGISLVVAAAASFLAAGVAGARGTPSRAAALWVAAAALVLAPRLLPAGAPDGPEAVVAAVQGNAPEDAGPRADDVEVFQNHLRLTRTVEGRRPDLVVWPESSSEGTVVEDAALAGQLRDAIRAVGAPFLVGATIDLPGARFLNATLFYRPDGSPGGRYVKMHLVPFGEYVPGRRLLVPLIGPLVEEIGQVPRDGIPGRTPAVFTIAQGKVASVICYESTYPGLVRRFVREGAGLLVVSTNNSSFARTAASAQHVAFSQLRAAEHHTWVIHAALTGISAVVAPTGEIVERTGLFEQEVLVPQVRFATRPTTYARFGDWVPLAAVAAAGLVGLAALAARVRVRRGAGT